MPARNEMQFEKLIDEATGKKDFQSLEQFLATEECENVSHKCSKQFVNKLDKLLCWAIKIDLPLFSLYMVNWFEKLKGILVLRGNEKNEMLTSLAEDFFIMLLVVCDSRPEGKMQILDNFVLRTCSLITDARINIYVQQEVIKKLNLLLDKIPRDARKKILSTKEMLLVMGEMGKTILDAGDYDTQVAITEALCRMVSEKQRGILASQWFPMEFVSTAFKGIKDSEFETLQIPVDENLEEFWIDFNVGSRSISFYVAAEDEDHQWETVIIQEEDVNMYSLEEKDSKKLLTIDLKSPMSVGTLEGEKFLLSFDSILEIKDVTIKIYGFHKCKDFNKKQSASVAKTTVHIVFDESGSQVLVPESQLSPGLKENSGGEEEKLSKYKTQQPPGSLRTWSKNNSQEKLRGDSSKKAKSKEMADAAKSLISKISNRYRDKSAEKSKARDSLGFNRDDVYNFNISGCNEPTIKLGIQELRVTELSVHTETNKKGNTAINKSSTEGKEGKKTRNNRDKKHLFSDSDTENRGDDSKTEISWLQESKRKPKAQIIDYSRSKKSGKPMSADKNKSPEPACHVDKAKGKNTNKKKINKCKPQNSKPNDMEVKPTREKLPRRAAATKNYKEPSSSESESEEKIPTCPSKEEKSKTQKYVNGANKEYRQPKVLQIVPVEPKRVDSYVQKALVKSRNSAEQKEVEMPSAESPASLETMRCAEGISGDVSPEHSSSERSLGLQESTPGDREVLNSERGTSPSNFCPQNESLQSLGVTQSTETAVTKLTFGRRSFSPVLTEASLLSLTTYKTVSGKNSKGAAAETCKNDEDSSFQHCFLDTFSVKGKLQDITKPIPKNKEETSLTTYKADSGKRAKEAVLETGNNNEDSSVQSCFSDTLCAKGERQDPTKALTKSKEDRVYRHSSNELTTVPQKAALMRQKQAKRRKRKEGEEE
ncbi:hypothetical protein DUI87_27964 [Hirundo rustica rustica]|uniref:Synaptonemal complex protein 2 Spt16M-like domain-containing protein n=1 Tax=Hirundo rustica rustica TaxID=333673 RepID=A0A3M0J677_HIRRU|nr:hypothetical protein DUI87_27964 [Hirundo rustica rustica]